MKESQEQINSQIYKICSICGKANLIINRNDIKNSVQNEKLKENMKYIKPSEFIKKCYCKNIKKDINNDNDIYTHKYCILLKVLYKFEIKCEKCNSFYNLKIDKKFDLKKALYIFTIFIFIYIIHLVIYFLIFLLLFIYKNVPIGKYLHLKYFFGIILFVLNSIILYFSIINNIRQYRYIFKYNINILNINNINHINNTNKFYQLLYDFYIWFYDKSINSLLNNRFKNFIINNKYFNYNKILKIYIKENNKEYNIKKKDIIINNNKNKDDIMDNNNNEYTLDNYLKLKNNSQKDNDNDYNNNNNFDNVFFINKKNSQIENNDNLLDDLYSDKTDNNNNEEDNNNKKNLIDMISLNKFNKDYINININPIQANNINININFNDLNNFNRYSSKNIHEHFNPNKLLHTSSGKTALIPIKNDIKKMIDDNTYRNYLKKRRQIKSIKLKQKDIKIKDTKIIGNIQENEEIDFSEFEKGKLDSKISKDFKLFLHKNTGVVNDIFKTKKSFLDVPLNISPSDSILYDETNNNRVSLKNNIISKNANIPHSNTIQFSKK